MCIPDGKGINFMRQTYRATPTFVLTEVRALLTYVFVHLVLPVSTAKQVSNCFTVLYLFHLLLFHSTRTMIYIIKVLSSYTLQRPFIKYLAKC